MFELAEQVYVLQNHHRQYTGAIYYLRRKLHYNAIPPEVVVIINAGNRSWKNRNMKVIDINGPYEATTAAAAASANKLADCATIRTKICWTHYRCARRR